MSEHVIKAMACNNWLTGTIDDHSFGIKVYDVGSHFGINDGRVSKLYVTAMNGKFQLIAYDRGWEEEPGSPGQEDLLDALIRFTASLPNHEVWEQSFKQWRYFVVTEDSVLEAAPYDHS